MQGDFLPQFAAQAIIDLESYGRSDGPLEGRRIRSNMLRTASAIRSAVHVVLPVNGEVYRSNAMGGVAPTSDECASFDGLPAPATCFEYAFDLDTVEGMKSDRTSVRRRITLVYDGKQMGSRLPREHEVFCATFVGVYYIEAFRRWALYPYVYEIATPIQVANGPGDQYNWGCHGRVSSLITGEALKTDDLQAMSVAGDFHADITAVVQCCHALRAGASLDEHTETSASRRWKFGKKGVGGFTYHLLSLPDHISRKGNVPIASGNGKRLHVRRAHIRKLPTGTLTFVRQCMVGDPNIGVVEKSYKVDCRPGMSESFAG
jgi:hypothetical protein